MFKAERGSMEEALYILQNIGLQLNEYEKTNSDIPVKNYKELLEFSISIARKTTEVSETIDEMIGDIESQL
ncbi:hypothetical protein LCM00_07695 [Bacillus infantis]|jgi:hypothetical protein|uniref:hypothetical protein n=1 Tax=Bacillus infantis TaxID=324767 RepID=UPI001CD65AB7|nr:hypothetical protein [Bacillus infantis]MCA1039373.1 hypothetical protein [Bacillus infantis]MCR6609916.1 hypothetical protein [Bacillus infantis]